MSIKCLVVIAVVFSACFGITFKVTGSFKCNVTDPAQSNAAVIVELMEADHTYLTGFMDADDELDAMLVHYKKPFEVTGSEYEIGQLEPYLMIRHHCGVNKSEPWKSFRYLLNPVKVYVFGNTEDVVINTGVIDLGPK